MAHDLVKPAMACLEVVEWTMPSADDDNASTEAMFTIAPSSRGFMLLAAARLHWNIPVTLMSMIRDHSSVGMSVA